MQYKVLVLDIDGTLTNSKKEISPKTHSAIRRLQEAGVVVVIASGRPTYGVVPMAEALELEKYGGYILSYNGGKIVNCKTNEVIFNQALPKGWMGKLAQMAKEHNCEIMSYDGDHIITTNGEDPYCKLESGVTHLPIMEVPSFAAYDEREGFRANKCLVLADGDHLAKVEPVFAKALEQEFGVFRSEPFFLEIVPKGVDKAYSLSKLLEHLGYTKEEMVACGDGYNDVSMIAYAGVGVAMANAQPPVKEAADFITRSNDEDGVAYAIEKFFA